MNDAPYAGNLRSGGARSLPTKANLCNAGEMPSMRIGVDLGGTKIEIVALGRDGRTVVRRRVASPSGHYDEIVATIGDLVESVEKRNRASEGRSASARPGRRLRGRA